MHGVLADWRTWALASAALAAATALLAKAGVREVDSNLATLIRVLILVPVLAALVLATGGLRPPVSLTGRTLLFLGLSALATGGSWLCYFHALKIGPASRVAPIDKLSVVLVAIGGVALYGERLSLAGWGGVVLITLGAVVLALS